MESRARLHLPPTPLLGSRCHLSLRPGDINRYRSLAEQGMSQVSFAASTLGHSCTPTAVRTRRQLRSSVRAEPADRASVKHSSESGGTAPDVPSALDSEGNVVQQAVNPRFNFIPHSRWPRGIPPVMGAHLMASGAVAPISTSAGTCPSRHAVQPDWQLTVVISSYTCSSSCTELEFAHVQVLA